MHSIKLEFDDYSCNALLFDIATAHIFYEYLPYKIELTQWGSELYGPIGMSIPEQKLTESIPTGGIAYTGKGNLLCIFFGQKPAWPVEHIGMIEQEDVEKLINNPRQGLVKIVKV